MSPDVGVVLLWLMPAAAAALIAWTRGRRLDRLRAQHARARGDVTALIDDLGHVLDQRDRLAVRVDALERDLAAERRHSDEWLKLACDNYRLFIDAKYTPAVPTQAPSDLDRARERRDARGRFVAKAVAGDG